MNIKKLEKDLKLYEGVLNGSSSDEENDVNLIDTAIKYMQDIQKLAVSISTEKDSSSGILDSFAKKRAEGQKSRDIKSLNSLVIKYENVYQQLFGLLKRYPVLQKVYGPYANNNMKFAYLFDCPTMEERRGTSKFSPDDKIIINLQNLKKNFTKVVHKTVAGDMELDSDESKTVTLLLKDPEISNSYDPETLNKILDNLKTAGLVFESKLLKNNVLYEEELDLTSEQERKIEILKGVLISYAKKEDAEDQIKKLYDPNNSKKIVDYINGKLKTNNEVPKENSNLKNLLNTLKSQVNNIPVNNSAKPKKSMAINTIGELEKAISGSTKTPPVSNDGPVIKKSAIDLIQGED